MEDQQRYEKKIILANDVSAANNAAAASKPLGDRGEEERKPVASGLEGVTGNARETLMPERQTKHLPSPNGPEMIRVPETIRVNAAAPTPAVTGNPTILTATSIRIMNPNGVPIYPVQPARSRECGLTTKYAVIVYAAALILATAGILAVRLKSPSPKAVAVTTKVPTTFPTGDPTKIPTPFPTGEPTTKIPTPFPTGEPTKIEYKLVTSGTCADYGYKTIYDSSKCKAAASSLGKIITWGPHGGYEDVVDGCSLRGDGLFSNPIDICNSTFLIGYWTYTGCQCVDKQPCFCEI